MEYREYSPHPALAAYVECYWSAIADQPPFQDQEALIPDGTIEWMFNFGDAYQWISTQEKTAVTDCHFIGVRTRSLFITQSNRQDFFSVRFKTAGCAAFWRLPIHSFADNIISAEQLIGQKVKLLEEQLANIPNEKRVQVVNQFLLKQLVQQQPALATSMAFLRTADQLNEPTIDKLSEKLNIGYKRLERHFKAACGLRPQQYLKIRRFNRAIRLLYSGKYASLTDVAYASGYYDQAHFNRDFRALTQQSPRQFLQQQFKIVEVIQPALAERLSKMYNF